VGLDSRSGRGRGVLKRVGPDRGLVQRGPSPISVQTWPTIRNRPTVLEAADCCQSLHDIWWLSAGDVEFD
jgi:hypothetical protein